MSGLSLDQGTQICRLLADPTRLRLLLLLEGQELTVAELTQITGLAQSRVSTHLGRLRETGLLEDRRSGQSVFYSVTESGGSDETEQLWSVLKASLDDQQIAHDLERAQQIVLKRRADQTWAESVAGRMDLHYSPGRTWETTARAMIGLLELGDVIDIASGDGVLAELLSQQARSVTCVDISDKVVNAGRQRLSEQTNVSFHQGDMHALPFDDASFDVALLMHALTYTRSPAKALREAGRVLRPGGRILTVTLKKHGHSATVDTYDHANLGYTESGLRRHLTSAGFTVDVCELIAKEQRPPYFEILAAYGTR